ncbi:hypothetical protein LINPERHAP1_LOCUS17765 [Linum perenne]
MLDILDLNLEAKEARKNLLHRGINITAAASATGSQETIYSTLGASGSNSLPPTRTQTTMSTLLKKDLRRDAAKSIARWFYLTGTSFNAAREPEYYIMFELAARHGPGFKPPSYHEIRETLLKEELEEVESKLCIFRNEWTKVEDLEKKLPIHKTTIAKGRKITNYIYGRAMLISMLKDFTKGGELIRPALTRFAPAYLTLGCLNEHNTFSSTREGKRIQGIVLDSIFWTSVLTCLRDAMPLMKVLRLVDSDESPSMPFLYLELNQAMGWLLNTSLNFDQITWWSLFFKKLLSTHTTLTDYPNSHYRLRTSNFPLVSLCGHANWDSTSHKSAYVANFHPIN